jgi:hypothetical protein
MSIVSAIFPPWQMLPISGPVRKELDRRKSNYGISYNKDDTVNLKDYKGPRRTWIRCASNAIVDGKKGFRFINDEDGFKNDYQIEGNQVLGKTIEGNKHEINSKIRRPVPGVVSVDLTVEKSIYRKAQIKWKCYSVEQLEYIGKYFFRLYSTVVLEWGWNNIHPQSLLELRQGQYADLNPPNGPPFEGNGLRGAYTNPSIIEGKINQSNGNYDAMIGHIIKWDYKYESDLSFTCTTEIASNSIIAFGLSMLNLTKDSSQDNTNPTSPFEYFKTNFESELLSGITDTIIDDENDDLLTRERAAFVKEKDWGLPKRHETATYKLKSYEDIDLKGKVFSFDKYKEKLKIPKNGGQSEVITFITFGLFCEVLNKVFIDNEKNKGTPTSVNINDAVIGAHINMISTNKDIYLIPNKFAPYFNITSIMDNYSTKDKNTISGKYIEKPLKKSGGDWGDFDTALLDVYGTNSARQDLHEVLTSFGGDVDNKNCFPQIVDNDHNESYNHGYIKDIFLNLNYIKTTISNNSNNLENLLKTLCEGLNQSNPWWKLEPTIDQNGKQITIVDQNYNNINNAIAVKDKLGIDKNSPTLYLFEPYTQNSILKDFNFDVRISDAVATQIIHSITSKLSSTGEYSSTVVDNGFLTQNTNISPSSSFDLLIEPTDIKSPEPNNILSKGTGTFDNRYVEEFNKIKNLVKEVDSQTLSIVKQADGKNFEEVEKRLEDIKKVKKELAKSVNLKQINIDTLKTEQEVIRLALPKNYSYLNQKATFYPDQENFPNRRNIPIPQAEVSFTIEGIGGIKTFQIFGIKNLPSYYSNSVIFKIKEIKHTIDREQGWNTQIIAAIIPVTKKQYENLTKV